MKKYTIEMIERPDGTGTIRRTNLGFSVFELIGLLESTKQSLMTEFIKDHKAEYLPHENTEEEKGATVKIEL